MSGFRLAQVPAGPAVPRNVERAVSSASFNKGALLAVDVNGKYAECGADPAQVAAVASTAYGADTTGFNILAEKEFPKGYMQGITPKDTVFRANYVGNLPAVDGGNYGVVKDSDSDWKVDFTDTINTVVKLVGRTTDSPESQKDVLVQFLANIIQAN